MISIYCALMVVALAKEVPQTGLAGQNDINLSREARLPRFWLEFAELINLHDKMISIYRVPTDLPSHLAKKGLAELFGFTRF